MQFETVFDAAQTGYRTWPFAAFGLIFVVVGALLVFAPLLMQPIHPGGLQGRPRVYFSRAFLGFAICWTTITFASTFSEYRSIRYALATGQYETVKGKVTDFIPMPHRGHAMESFSVNHVNFSYSDFVITNGFNNTSSHGGPIREGVDVRISHIGNTIIKLEVATKALGRSKPQ
ncbi:hypothetical protein [Taklimakanibacter deserti]|uniref:hypothetical protein n=1 Tax=Taklimakanibacter deserti TaxID=2267839 RepID=UPI000E64E745